VWQEIMVRQHFKRKELTMNKIFFGIHTSLLLLLCALLACCSQDEEEYASTEKLVPLDISAVIDGMGTRADATEKTEFSNGDEITITIDGDESGKSYIYVYDGSNWNPKEDNDNDNRLFISSDATEVKITARYGYVDLSALGTYDLLNATSLINSLVATAKVSYTKPNAELEFKHDACKIVINVICSGDNMSCSVDVFDETIRSESILTDLFTQFTYTNSEQAILYIPTTANYILSSIVASYNFYNYRINLSSLDAGKTYTCNIVVP
jgi:hypothetical protein